MENPAENSVPSTRQEATQDWLRFLLEASEILASSLDYETTIASVARLVVPRIADWCAVDMLDDNGVLQRIAVEHVDPNRLEWARALQRKYPADPNATRGLYNVVRTGSAELYEEITSDMLAGLARSDDHLEMLQQVGFSSAIIAPLTARGKILGTLTLVTAESRHHYNTEELALAEDLARRAAVAVDNARLFREAEQSREALHLQQESLHISEQRFRTMIEQSPMGIQIFAPNGDYILANRAWEELWDASRDYLAGYNILRDEQLKAKGIMPHVEQGFAGIPTRIPPTLYDPAEIGKPGRIRWVRAVVYPVKGSDDAIREVVVMLEDVTDNMTAEEELQRKHHQLEVILDGVADGISAQRPDGRLIYVNDAAARLSGFASADEMLKIPPAEIVGRFEIVDETGESVDISELPGRIALRESRPVEKHLGVRVKGSNEERWSVVRSTPVFDNQGKVVMAINIFRDVTGQLRSEQALRTRLIRLQEIYRLSEAVSRAEALDHIFAIALDGVVATLGADHAAIHVCNDDGTRSIRASRGVAASLSFIARDCFGVDREDRETLAVSNIRASTLPDNVRESIHRVGIESLANIPLIFNDQVLGSLCIYFDLPHSFSQEELQLAQTFASHLAVAIERRRSQEEIQGSEERLRLALEAAHMGTWNWIVETGEVRWSDGIEKIHGLPAGSFGGSFEDYLSDVHPDDRKQLTDSIGATLARGTAHNVEYRIVLPDESIRWVEGRGRVFRDEQGNAVRLAGVCMDITARKHSEEAIRFQAHLLDTVEQAVIATNLDGRILYWNRFAETMYGWSSSDVIGHNIIEVVSTPQSRAEALAIMNKLRRNESWSGEHLVQRQDGTVFPALVTNSPVHDEHGTLVGVIGVSIDITESKRAETELKLAKEAAEAADRAKGEFLAVLSHELRTPLTPVMTMAHALAEDDSLPPALRESIEMIRRNVELEARLIDDLLDLTRITQGRLQLTFEAVDVGGLLDHVIEICRSDIAQKRINFSTDLGAAEHVVRADPARLQQVLWNLLKNAIKFTPEGGTITVRTINGEAGRLVLTVSDTGIGIEPELLPHIFNAFEQGERETPHRFGGLGLGLTIARTLIDLHHGTLAVTSGGRNQGATFTVTLDTVTPPADGRAEVKTHNNRIERETMTRILIVDDHLDTSKVMQMMLERRGYAVRTAESVQTALDAIRLHEFDLLISDIGLPDGSGIELIQKIRQELEMPAIALSGYGMEEDIRRSIHAGFNEHLTKPVAFKTLNEAIIRLTRHTASQETA